MKRRRVLIIAGAYAPVISAEMHRARHLAWTLPNSGWDVEILAPGIAFQQTSYIEPNGEAFFAPGVSVHTIERPSRLSKLLGLRGIGWRALFPAAGRALKLLKSGRFDIVYISTTQFPLFLLGPILRWLTGTPYVLDVQDPIYRPGVSFPQWDRPRLRHRVAYLLLRFVERISVPSADGLIAVSPEYIADLAQRYRSKSPFWLQSDRNAAIPFAVLPEDFAVVENANKAADRSTVRIVYVGAGGPIMRKSFSLFCAALSRWKDKHPDSAKNVRVELYGTMLNWKAGDPKELQDIAQRNGVESLVNERPERVTYRRSLELLNEADAVLVLGVDEKAYMPSKLFSCAFSGKPLLGLFRAGSPAWLTLADLPNLGHLIWMSPDAAMPQNEVVLSAFLDEAFARRNFERQSDLQPYGASRMAKRHAELFERCLVAS